MVDVPGSPVPKPPVARRRIDGELARALPWLVRVWKAARQGLERDKVDERREEGARDEKRAVGRAVSTILTDDDGYRKIKADDPVIKMRNESKGPCLSYTGRLGDQTGRIVCMYVG